MIFQVPRVDRMIRAVVEPAFDRPPDLIASDEALEQLAVALDDDFMIRDGHDVLQNESLKEDQGDEKEQRQENRNRILEHVPEERRHPHARFLGDALHHEVGGVADVRVRSEENGRRRYRLQINRFLGDEPVDTFPKR